MGWSPTKPLRGSHTPDRTSQILDNTEQEHQAFPKPNEEAVLCHPGQQKDTAYRGPRGLDTIRKMLRGSPGCHACAVVFHPEMGAGNHVGGYSPHARQDKRDSPDTKDRSLPIMGMS